MNKTILEVTENIINRSTKSRELYLAQTKEKYHQKVSRSQMSCANLAHTMASADAKAKIILKAEEKPNLAIISAYNDVLSAHAPYARYPELIKNIAINNGAVAQMASGVPAMCDGITQGQVGMELSLFSRDTIALATVIGLSHNVFDANICLGICDKIVPGLLIGSLSFGHLPTIFIPSGPMGTGLSNKEKVAIRTAYAENKVSKEVLLEAEIQSYHDVGTCTFYGTANSNQMLLEIMGLHIPGSAFIPPNTLLRDKLTEYAVKQLIRNTDKKTFRPLSEIVSEKTIVNAVIGLLATGGSTNHTIHLVAIAKAAGIIIDWNDFAKLAKVIPLLAKVYPNGEYDINYFQNAGGVAFVIKELLKAGLLHDDVLTVVGNSLSDYINNPYLTPEKNLSWQEAVIKTDFDVLRNIEKPFDSDGGLKVLIGNIGRSISKISAIAKEFYYIKAKAKVFLEQHEVEKAFKAGELNEDCIVVLPFQGPIANGMPELHGLSSIFNSLQNKGYKIAFITDGRLSGASGKIPSAIHLVPEAAAGGNIAKIRTGDLIELDLLSGTLNVLITENELLKREPTIKDLSNNYYGTGRELFKNMHQLVTSAEEGGSFII